MADADVEKLAALLRQSQTLMIELSGRHATAERDWDRAQSLLQGARQIDAILQGLGNDPKGPIMAPEGPGRELPYYYVQYDKLVKVGRSRDGGTYEQRVTRADYDVVLDRLRKLADKGPEFETQSLVDQCPIPKHEPGIVVNALHKLGLIESVRRGRWAFADAPQFHTTAGDAWRRVPRS